MFLHYIMLTILNLWSLKMFKYMAILSIIFCCSTNIFFFPLSLNLLLLLRLTPLNRMLIQKARALAVHTHSFYLFFSYNFCCIESSLLNYTAAILDSCGGVVMLVSIIFAILLKTYVRHFSMCIFYVVIKL